jgi:YfiH family protein
VIQRVVSSNGVVIYQSPLLQEAGVPHAFSTRIGGVSEGPFASLNLGNPAGQARQDLAENIAENYRRLHQSIGCADRTRYFAHQVHGATVLDPNACAPTDSIHGGVEIGKGDALVTSDSAVLLSVRVADCVPILMADRSGRRASAIHAGWRGVVAGIAIEALKRFDRRSEVVVAIGPHISIEHFEVGPEVLEAFQAVFGAATPFRDSPKGGGKSHIDLQEALKMQLIALGVPSGQIDTTDRCSVGNGEEFFSHRRCDGLTGRMAAVIGVRA